MEGLLDISVILRPGVFLLWNHGRVVYIGKAKCLLAGIAIYRTLNRANLPSWVPLHRIVFDKVEIVPCSVDRATSLAQALIALHNPIHNRTKREASILSTNIPPSPTPTHVRRL